MQELFEKFLNREQIENIKTTIRKDRSHPVKKLFIDDKNFRIVFYNTEYSLKNVLSKDIAWLKSNSDRLSELEDYSTPSSVLGEIRAYGYLLGANFNVKSVQENKEDNTPDFIISNEEGEEIEVEVNSKQYSSEESKQLEEFNSIISERNRLREQVITPFGKAKEGENIAENVISKLASIKQKEKQFSNDKPSILWLDFQDEIWNLGLQVDSTQPIRSWREEFYTGEIWYAFYGTIGLPIFEQSSIEERIRKSSIAMRHEGRFRLNSNIDACVISLPEYTVILENINSTNKIPSWFWKKATFINRFNIENSWINWPENKLNERISIELERIQAFKDTGLFNW